ncbi:MAG: protein-L-isoaspartate O-methyltransferase [Betaproteobacteria bacterium]|nr:MAG: protein-L-isoaspartate O-methyltransferase [Betaproteobacteria bacterium]
MDFEKARFNMVEQQIRTWEVLDPNVLDLLIRVRREEYVPAQYRSLAFTDMEIPLGFGETMLAPKLEARLIQAASVQPTDRVLEVGTGSGYMAALLSSLGEHVYTVEIVPELSEQAQRKFADHGLTNITAEVGDAARGWEAHAPYDAIVVTGSSPTLPPSFERSLAPGGRLIVILGDPPVMTAHLLRRVGDGCSREGLFETCIRPLRNAPQPERFVF